MFARMTLRALPTLATLLWATASQPASASLIELSGPPAPANSLTFFANGGLSGVVPIDLVAPTGAGSTGPSFAITNGLLLFNLGPSQGGDATHGFAFGSGGSLTIVGSFNGGPQEVILAVSGKLGGGFLQNIGSGGPGSTGSRWEFFLGTIGWDTGVGSVDGFAKDVSAAYAAVGGIDPFSHGFGVDFTGTPGGANGGVDAGAVVVARFSTVAAVVPEPGSAGMMAVGCGGLGIVLGFCQKNRVVFLTGIREK